MGLFVVVLFVSNGYEKPFPSTCSKPTPSKTRESRRPKERVRGSASRVYGPLYPTPDPSTETTLRVSLHEETTAPSPVPLKHLTTGSCVDWHTLPYVLWEVRRGWMTTYLGIGAAGPGRRGLTPVHDVLRSGSSLPVFLRPGTELGGVGPQPAGIVVVYL